MMHKATCRSFWSGRASACDCQVDSPQNGTLHCQQCGTTDLEYVGMSATTESEGYSLCCNEIVMIECETDMCDHLREGS